MRLLRSLLAAPIVCAVLLSAGIYTHPIPAKAEQWIGRSVTLGGRKVQCHNAQIMIDRTLPSEGGAGDDFVILNPDMLKNQPETVRIFVFKHECGHLTVGDSELKADCFAVQQGVHEHWLDRKGLDQVCQSFDGAPETSTHPSAERRCRNLDQCYAAALAVEAKANPPTGTPAPAPVAAKPPTAKKPVAANKAPAPQTAAAKPVPGSHAAGLQDDRGQGPCRQSARCTAFGCGDTCRRSPGRHCDGQHAQCRHSAGRSLGRARQRRDGGGGAQGGVRLALHRPAARERRRRRRHRAPHRRGRQDRCRLPLRL